MSQELDRIRRPPPRKSSLAASEPIALLNASRAVALERGSRAGGRFPASAAARIRGSGSDSEGLSNETPGDEEEEEEEDEEDEEDEEEEDEIGGRGRRKGFAVRAAFLLTPSRELTLERATGLCERMRLRCPFSLSRTATGILFKFADADDFKAVFRKGFHRVTGARRYWKVSLPCRPLRAYAVMVLDVPEEVPIEDIRFALRPKFPSVIDVVRLRNVPGSQIARKSITEKDQDFSPVAFAFRHQGGVAASVVAGEGGGSGKGETGGGREREAGKRGAEEGGGAADADGGGGEMGDEEEEEEAATGEEAAKKKGKGGGGQGASPEDGREKASTASNAVLSVRPSRAKGPVTAVAAAPSPHDPVPPLPVRVTLTSQEEANILLQVGLDFYGATHFPTEPPPPGKKKSAGGGAGAGRGGTSSKGVGGTATPYDWGPGTLRRRVRELLPVFDSRFAAPSERKVKPRSQ